MSFRISSRLLFRATSSIRAGAPKRADVDLSMSKWWAAFKHQDGLVTQHLSPFEQQALMPWVRTWPKRLYEKFVASVFDWAPSLGLMYAIVEWSEWKHHDIAHHHRD
ncbi:hypothetical protein TrCOL_g13186 [Triparma columacea]|uniref:Cytochrome b-c1 complex subunit 8 n=1 Tax=Triparma columacea TaxID=722753 RepID=A0A9W7GNK8_9STRA|nr:hypothetical protein TrCOL_g13186 [Triparma columacea]